MCAIGSIFKGKNVLVTGHTGFKGAWLSEWLLMLDAKVTGYSIDEQDPSLFHQLRLSVRLDDRRGDVRDLQRLHALIDELEPEFIFHLAAQPLVRQSYSDPVGTFTTNVTGSIHLMEAVRRASHRCAVVMVTTDKCYENQEWVHGYRESDPMGGHDPYSASKGAAELAINAYRRSFFPVLASEFRVALASARAGNVLGGCDWATDRIVPDSIRALRRGEVIAVRNKAATRPWQHVLEPLSGYLSLAAELWTCLGEDSGPTRRAEICSAFNFGPQPASTRSVEDLVMEVLKHWPGQWSDLSDPEAPHEASLLNLAIDKAFHLLRWRPVWNFEEGVAATIWLYKQSTVNNADPQYLLDCTRKQIDSYTRAATVEGLPWAQMEPTLSA